MKGFSCIPIDLWFYRKLSVLQSCELLKLKIFPVPVRLHSGYMYGKFIFVIISPFFAIFKNAVHSLEPGETPSYSASHQALKLCTKFLNIAKHFKTVAVRLRLVFQFTCTYVQYCKYDFEVEKMLHISTTGLAVTRSDI